MVCGVAPNVRRARSYHCKFGFVGKKGFEVCHLREYLRSWTRSNAVYWRGGKFAPLDGTERAVISGEEVPREGDQV